MPTGDRRPRQAPEFESMFIMPQHRYRYRTAILVGPWRESRLEAERDAVAARQARFEEGNGGTLIWRCPGTIEADGGDRRN